MAGYRNLGMIAAGTAEPEFLLFVGIGQVPMYTLPALGHPVYRRLLARAAPHDSPGSGLPSVEDK